MTPFLSKFRPEVTIPEFANALGVEKTKAVSVLHVSAGNLFGGIERMLLAFARNADYRPGMRHTFGLCFHGRVGDELSSSGAAVNYFGKVSFRNPLAVWLARRNMRLLLQSRQFDFVICHGSWIHALFARVICKAGVPLVHMVHGIIGKLSRYDQWSKNYPPNLVIANSIASADCAKSLFPDVPLKVAYPPCELGDPRLRESVRIQWRGRNKVKKDTKVILAAGRLEGGKGLSILLHALSQIKKWDSWTCWVAGGPQRPSDSRHFSELRGIAHGLGIGDRIQWLGHVKDMDGHFAAADVYCQPNVLPESFGLTFIEAQAMGCPVITTAMGGALEAVEDNGINTLLAKPCPDLLAQALEKHLLMPGRYAVT